MTGWRIVCDVGGTNIRVARSDGPMQLRQLQCIATECCTSLSKVLQDYWQQFEDRENLVGAAVAAAGPVETGSVTLTNSPLTIERAAVSAELGGRPVDLINDLEATAYALPYLTAEDMLPVVPAENSMAGPRLVVNVGTGFGAALLVPAAAGWHVVATEAGHMTFEPFEQSSGRERATSSAPSIEDKLSGMALSSAHTLAVGPLMFSPAFGELFGAVCGNLVLATGAWGGVALSGSVATAWCRIGDFASFTAAFQNKGRMTKRMSHVQVDEIVRPHPALIGLTIRNHLDSGKCNAIGVTGV